MYTLPNQFLQLSLAQFRQLPAKSFAEAAKVSVALPDGTIAIVKDSFGHPTHDPRNLLGPRGKALLHFPNPCTHPPPFANILHLASIKFYSDESCSNHPLGLRRSLGNDGVHRSFHTHGPECFHWTTDPSPRWATRPCTTPSQLLTRYNYDPR